MIKPNVVGKSVECTVCGRRKQPIGRSAPLESYLCDSDCPGHRQDPWPGWLWPGETQKDFGYCLDCGTRLTGESELECAACCPLCDGKGWDITFPGTFQKATSRSSCEDCNGTGRVEVGA